MPHGADYRDTTYELHQTTQKANGLVVVVSARAADPDVVVDPSSPTGSRLVARRLPDVYLDYDGWTDDELALDVAYRTMLENKVAAKLQPIEVDPAAAAAAKLDEALQAEARKRAAEEEAAQIEAATAAKRDELAALEAQAAALASTVEVPVPMKAARAGKAAKGPKPAKAPKWTPPSSPRAAAKARAKASKR